MSKDKKVDPPQWTLENDWPGNSPVNYGRKGSDKDAVKQTPGQGEVAKYESYGRDGIKGPSYPPPKKD